ncbi:MAG TPA: hypothetical protein VFK61_03070 [Candidatus Limnocylindria bacterium]|nr:hypothetical protein [Candidatus Limnocylindria bacterium]
MLAACVPTASGSPSGSPSATPQPLPTEQPSPSGGTPDPSATATPEPLSLELPADQDRRTVAVDVDPQVPPGDNGQIVVTVTNRTDRRVPELVLRWPTALRDNLFLAPFRPSEQRIADGGPPLIQDWTKWVDGPGESGEPAGTTSLGWGPLLPGGTLTIPILVTRNARGEVAFDFQVLAGESILTQPDGEPAELRVSVP